MTRGDAAVLPRAARRIKNIAAVLILVLPVACTAALAAQPRAQPLITIPPANLSPPPASPSPSVTAARALLPSTLQTVHDAEGAGTAACGALTGKAASAVTVLLALLGTTEALDQKPALQVVLAEQGDRRAEALFTATRNGAQALGVAAATLSDTGGGVTLLSNDATVFAASFLRLLRALAPDEVEIGISDNSASQSQAVADCGAARGWQPVIATAVKAGESPLDPALAQSLAERLTSGTGVPWRIVPAAELK
jgi:hypothetical protein